MLTATETLAEQLATLGLWQGIPIDADPGETLASPSWWGADSRRYRLRSEQPDARCGSSAFVKVMEPYTRAYIDVSNSFAAIAAAGAAGIAPVVLAADADAGVLVTADLTDVCRTATLDMFVSPDAVSGLVEIRRAVQQLPAFGRSATVFDDLRSALAVAKDAGAMLPVDLPWMLRLLSAIESRIVAAGYDTAPIHGDGNVSNVLLLDTGELRLIDFDSAVMADPIQDLGVLLAELDAIGSDLREVFEMSWGSWHPALFERARGYAIADHVRRGLIGVYCDAARPGTQEYSKFADWQFLRARAALADPRFAERLRQL